MQRKVVSGHRDKKKRVVYQVTIPKIIMKSLGWSQDMKKGVELRPVIVGNTLAYVRIKDS